MLFLFDTFVDNKTTFKVQYNNTLRGYLNAIISNVHNQLYSIDGSAGCMVHGRIKLFVHHDRFHSSKPVNSRFSIKVYVHML